MTVAELIKELRKYPQNLPVCLAYDNGLGGEVIRIFQEEIGCVCDKDTVYLSEDKEI